MIVSVNIAQGSESLLQVGALVINEVDADQVSTDSAEFIELYDGGVGNTNLTGLVLVLYNGSDNLSYISFDLDGQSTDGDGYFVLCGNAANVANCDLDVSPDTNLIQNGEDAVTLLVGDAVNYPNDTALPADGDILDAIVYETGSDTNSGLLVLLNAGQSVVDEGAGGNQTGHSNQRCANGTGGARNTFTYTQAAPSPGADNTCVGSIAPVVTTSAGTTQFTAGGGPVTVDGGVTVTDFDDVLLDSVTVEITNPLDGAAEVLAATPSGGILGGDIVFAGSTLTINPAVPDTLANFQTVMQSVTYNNSSTNPDNITDRVIRFVANDGTANSNNADKTVSIARANISNIIINEVDADQVSTDSAEFIELYDSGVGNMSLTGLVLVLYNGSDNLSYISFDLDGQSTDGDGYFVLCANAANVANCDLDVSPDANLIQNGEDAVTLLVGDAVNYLNDTDLPAEGDILDAIVYETGSDSNSGLLVLLNAGQAVVDEGGGGDQTGHSNQRCANGSGGARNTDTYTQAAPSPGADNNCEAPPPTTSVIINEVDADQVSTDSAEFIELYDGGTGNTDLSGLAIVLYNGSDNLSYIAFDLDGQSTDGDGYFVLCGNAANVANCDLDVSPNTNLIQNGEDAATLLVGNAVNYPNDTALPSDGDIVDAIVYETGSDSNSGLLVLLNAGQAVINEGAGGNQTGHSNQRCANGSGGARNTDTYTQAAPTPGAANNCGGGEVLIRKIHEVQGSGATSPDVGNTVTVEAIVVGDFQTGLRGYYLQEENSDVDGDPATSEGVFVFDDASNVSVGDLVRVTGGVQEYFSLTEIAASQVEVLASGQPLPASAVVILPVAALDEWERYEGMRVTIPQELTATEHYQLGRFGQMLLSVGGRLQQPTNVTTPGAAANALQAANDLRQIMLDDGSSRQWPDPVIYPAPGLDAFNTVRGGDTIPSLTGVVDYSFGIYRVHALGPVFFTPANARPATPAVVDGSFKVASFNVLNYFTTIDTGSNGARGADSAVEFERQRAKIIEALRILDADVVGLIEIENNATEAVQNLVDGLNAALGSDVYSLVDTGMIGTDAIKLAFIYKTATTTPVGDFAVLDSSVDPTFLDTKNRPVLAQTFVENATNGIFTVAVNHLKSKGSSCNDVGDPNAGDGQGNCNGTRTNAAIALANWLATDPTGSNDDDFVIVGDLNAYAMEDPIAAIEGAGYTNLVAAFGGSAAYSYVFDGQWGYLDHALSNGSLTPQVTGATVWHINADEPNALDYNDAVRDPGESSSNTPRNLPGSYAPNQYRASDHDPVLIGLDLIPTPIEVVIDIKPDSDENPINLMAGGVVPVAILSSADFDATLVDPSTVTLAGAPVAQRGQGRWMVAFEDVNGDGLTDMLLHVETQALGLVAGDSLAVLEGALLSGIPIVGSDVVRTVPGDGLQLVLPENGATVATVSPLFTWTSPAEAACYLIQIDDDPAFGSPEQEATVVGEEQYTATTLATGRYFWRVQVGGACSIDSGPWSAVWSFTVS